MSIFSMNESAGISPKVLEQKAVALNAGIFYLITIVTAIIAQIFISGRLVVPGDALTTADNILTHKYLFEAGYAIYLVEMICQVVTTVLIYILLRPVSSSIALVSVCIGLAGCIIKTIGRLFYAAPLIVLSGPEYLSTFNSEQLQSLSLLFLSLNDIAAEIALVFFGFHTIIIGCLFVKSNFVPNFIGYLTILGGIGWLSFLYPPLGKTLFPFVSLLALMGVFSLITWLIVFGINKRS